ncbi:type II toxin-antitoxin system VapC family toxin [Clostridium estertheticum]|uniref:PIN domain-containing protein n=1 Tax=Clostridium estertheticum subsp. estertheticum TaxID=1552 RepID=A0A1J0GID5_9CLOT|nr:type II toxin-antitoxin system VapC family toxin [Clostridium estertheticum]APC41039.1 hypothetical protein A7L45_13620 [Clostridium estertheticum subsp. estertheticum]
MCIIIDTNVFASVFNCSSAEHEDFKPVLDWITKGSGKAVIGGNTYRTELKKAKRYLKLFTLLASCNKIIHVDDAEVDQIEINLKKQLVHRDFDDPHLIALTIVSKTKLICSGDARAYKYIKDPNLYPKCFNRPKIYKGKENKNLLIDENIPDKYKPVNKLNKARYDSLSTNFSNII